MLDIGIRSMLSAPETLDELKMVLLEQMAPISDNNRLELVENMWTGINVVIQNREGDLFIGHYEGYKFNLRS